MIKKLRSIINKEIVKSNAKNNYRIKVGEVAKVIPKKTLSKASF